MRIAVDYCDGAEAKRAGKGEYVYQLVRQMVSDFPKDNFDLLVSKGQSVDLVADNVRVVSIPASRGPLWHILALAWLGMNPGIGAYFSTTSVIVPALLAGRRTVTTIFDFTSWRFPATHDTHAQKIEKIFMKLALVRSSKLLAISEFTKREAMDLFHVPAAKMKVTPLAVDPSFATASSISESELGRVRAKYSLPSKFILCLATIEPRKNMTAVIEAYKKLRAKFPDLSLVIAGNPGWYSADILATANDGVVVTGYVDASDRAAIYRLATVFAFPSLYEGFGMPPLEAITAGTPAVVSNRASLPEAVGSAGVQVSLENPAELETRLAEVIKWTPAQRIHWRELAAQWAGRFSWKETSRLTMAAIKEVQ